MYDEKDIETSTENIEMPPLGYEVGEPAEAVEETNELPPEIKQAQEYERQMALEREQAQQAQNQPEPIQQPVVSAKDKEANLRILRESAERAIREREEMARKLQEYENAKIEAPDEDFNIKEEDLVEGKHLSKAIKRIRQLEQQQKQYMQQSNATTAEMRLRAQYPDFDRVMTLDNIQMLGASYPELAKSINASSDLYEKATSAYTIIKKFGIYNEAPAYDGNKQKALANAVKPRPTASVSPQKGESPLSRANAFSDGLTEELKEKLRKEMDEYAKLY